MKKYNKPEIETLALDMVDVIETSGETKMMGVLETNDYVKNPGETTVAKQTINESIESMSNTWTW